MEHVQKKDTSRSNNEASPQGKSIKPPSFQLKVNDAIQRMATDPPGRGVCTDFGDFWVVADDTKVCYQVKGEQITETEYAALTTTWAAIKSGTGSLLISETDSAGTAHAGFKTMIIDQLAKLMSKPVGRTLLAGIVNGSNKVTIQPSATQIYGGANATRGAGTLENADGTAGAGGTTMIQVDANLKDEDVMVYDKAGKEIGLPIFITLGHELIHAKHNSEGRNRREKVATDAAYSNMEEEETIATGTLTENNLRTEHGLTLRHGHGGIDKR